MGSGAWTPERRARQSENLKRIWADRSDTQRAQIGKKISEDNKRRDSTSHLKGFSFTNGQTPWNKGNDWTDGLSQEEVRNVKNEWMRRHRTKSVRRTINERVSALIRFTLKRAGASKARVSWPKLLGYGVKELTEHLKTTIPPGFTWQDYVDGRLELDHKVPVSAHNFASATDSDFRRCWSLSNLQLLPAWVNLDKRAKLSAPFQPHLSF